jgi:outer membrane protein
MKWRRQPPSLSVLGAVFALSATVQHANAQAIGPDDSDSWKFAIGAGAVSAPKYPGSSSRRFEPIPLLSASYGRYFIGGLPGAGVPVGLGMNIIESSDWKFGVGLGIDLKKPRKESDDARLTGLGDISGTPHGAVFGSYTHDWFSVRSNVVTDIGGKHEGTLASLELEGRYRLTPNLTLSAGPGLVWADKKYSQTFFGIDAAQSANSGLAPYAAGAGLNSLRFSVGAEYRFDAHWFVGARATAATLRGDARRSPITSDTSQNTFGIFGGYHF